jgi:hypothetical protein
MRYSPLSTARGAELDPRAGDAVATIHVPTSATFYEAAIEGLTRLNEEMLLAADRAGNPFPPIYDTDVGYRKEAADTWRHADDVLCSGWGDCEDLAAWRAAELRVYGEDTGARVYVYKSGPHRYHAVVARGNGRIEDPSLILGMVVSPKRRALMPKHEGDTEMDDTAPRAFATCSTAAKSCSNCGGCQHQTQATGTEANVLGAIGFPGRSLLSAVRPRIPRRPRVRRPVVMLGGYDDDADGGIGDEAGDDTGEEIGTLDVGAYDDNGQYYDDGGPQQYDDGNQQQYDDPSQYQQLQPYQPPARGGNPSKFDTAFKWGVAKPTQLVTKLAYHAVSVPFKALKKITSLFGEEIAEDCGQGDVGAEYLYAMDNGPDTYHMDEQYYLPNYADYQAEQDDGGQMVQAPVRATAPAARPKSKGLDTIFKWGVEAPTNLLMRGAKEAIRLPLTGLKKISSWMVGIEGDEDYIPGDELIDAHPTDLPISQKPRFETIEVKPGIWAGQVKVPTTEPGKVLTMTTSPATNEQDAADRMLNLAKAAVTSNVTKNIIAPGALGVLATLLVQRGVKAITGRK